MVECLASMYEALDLILRAERESERPRETEREGERS